MLPIEDGFLWEEGPNSFQPSSTILRFAKVVDITFPVILFIESRCGF